MSPRGECECQVARSVNLDIQHKIQHQTKGIDLRPTEEDSGKMRLLNYFILELRN